MAKKFHWIADYTVRLIDGKEEDRRTKVFEAENILGASEIAQEEARRVAREDPEVTSAFVYDVGIMEHSGYFEEVQE